MFAKRISHTSRAGDAMSSSPFVHGHLRAHRFKQRLGSMLTSGCCLSIGCKRNTTDTLWAWAVLWMMSSWRGTNQCHHTHGLRFSSASISQTHLNPSADLQVPKTYCHVTMLMLPRFLSSRMLKSIPSRGSIWMRLGPVDFHDTTHQL